MDDVIGVYVAAVAPLIEELPDVDAVVFEYHWYINPVPIASTINGTDEVF